MPDYLGFATGYTQYANLPHVIAKENDHEALTQAAQHFESLFIDMWLKSSRDANQAFGTSDLFASSEMQTHQQMMDHEMAVHLSQNGGIGLADVIVRQLKGETFIDPKHLAEPAAVDRTTPSVNGDAQQFGTRTAAFASPQAFVRELRPMFERALQDTELPVLGVLSQAALETGWGGQVITGADGQVSHNLFGVKNTAGGGANVEIRSLEFNGSGWSNERSRFKAYPNWQASLNDYIATLKNSPNYADVIQGKATNVAGFAAALADAGYATDPQYADKIVDIHQRLEVMLAEETVP